MYQTPLPMTGRDRNSPSPHPLFTHKTGHNELFACNLDRIKENPHCCLLPVYLHLFQVKFIAHYHSYLSQQASQAHDGTMRQNGTRPVSAIP